MNLNTKKLEYKIKKYTNKLRNADSPNSAEIYQNKLRYYHAMNKYGGMDIGKHMMIVGDMQNKLDNELIKLQDNNK